MKKNILICGVGGQGTVLASRLISEAALKKGLAVMSAETIGMAQKGGSVFSHIRLGDDLKSPLIPKGQADLIIGCEPAEAVRMLPFLKKDGAVVVNSAPVKPVTAALTNNSYDGSEMLEFLKKIVKRLTIIDCRAAAKQIGSAKVANIILLGAALRTGELPISEEDLAEAIKSRVKKSFVELNIKALQYA